MVVLLLLTYNRLGVARRTLEALAKNLCCSESLWLHIADDGSPQEYRDELLDLARSHYEENVSITNSERSGYGGNYNAATQVIHRIGDIVLPIEDDWELVRELDISLAVKVLRDGTFGCVRMGYVGYTQELWSKFVWAEGLHWLALDPDSPERHVWTGGPRLETVDWERAVGPWPEGLEQGLTEFEVSGRVAARNGVAWPIDLIKPMGDAFVHIGSEKAEIEGIAGSNAAMQVGV